MPGQTLTTNIVINARAGNGFSQVGATLQELGSLVNGLSQPLIEFGKESINVYREYEKSMKDAEVALSTEYGRGTSELSAVMKNLDDQATEWAATTIFHTNDVSNAISEAAHAGWDYEQIMYGLPAAMQLAQAGGLDLSEAVNYIVKSTNAAGIEFEDLTYFTDLWTYAANSSASTVGEFGEAMLRMGSTMRFASNPEELMTLMAVTANAGSVGSEAGTMIRNSIMRLVAPTDKASEAMAELGVTSDEAATLLNDESLAAANAELAARGFTTYDQQGKLRPILDIYRDMYEALGDIAGSYEDIDKNEDTLGILSAIFPTRTITEALNLLRAASSEYDGLYEAMMNGEAEGYGAYAAETRMNSLDGRIEIFNSKVERLKQVVGEGLSDDVSSFLGGLGDVVDRIAGLDEGKMSALISGGEMLAGLGPAMIGLGGVMRLIGNLTPVGGALLAGVGALAAARALKEYEDVQYENGFGTAAIDLQTMHKYASELHSDFENAYAPIEEFRNKVEQSVDSFQTASESFSGKLFTDMVTGTNLSVSEKVQLYNLADQMYSAVKEGIENRASADTTYWQMLFGGEGTAKDNPYFQEVAGVIATSGQEAVSEAESIAAQIKSALTSAFADGEIDEAEYENILNYMRSYNEALAKAAEEAQEEQSRIEIEKELLKSQGIGLESAKESTDVLTGMRDAELQEAESEYYNSLAAASYQAKKQGTELSPEFRAQAETNFQEQIAGINSKYNVPIERVWSNLFRGSDYEDAYGDLQGLASEVMGGRMSVSEATAAYKGMYGSNKYAGEIDFLGNNTRTNIAQTLAREISALGGYEQIESDITGYMARGDSANAENLMALYLADAINNNQMRTSVKKNEGFMAALMGDETISSYSPTEAYTNGGFSKNDYVDQFIAPYIQDYTEQYTAESAKNVIDRLKRDTSSGLGSFMGALEKANAATDVSEIHAAASQIGQGNAAALSNIVQSLSESYDFSKVLADTMGGIPFAQSEFSDTFAAWSLMYGPASVNAEDYRLKVTPEVDMSSLPELPPVPMPIEPYVEGEDAIASLQNQGVDVTVSGDTAQLQATIDGADGQNLMEYVDGDASDLHMSIMTEDGQTLVENVTGNTSALAAAIQAYNGTTITVNIQGRRMFAEGGRATEASIFGEAGPEWAIPEEHSERTAELLNAARAASGFTWADLIARYGGLNANVNNTPSTFVYAPVINAQNAEGVERVLREDKERMENWWAEHQMREAMEVYA